MKGWLTVTIESVCNVEYGTRVVQKRDGGSIFPVYGGGGATFFMDAKNRANRVIVARFGMSEACTRYVSGDFFLNDSGLTLSPRDAGALLPEFLDRQILALNDEIFALGKGSAQKNLDVPAFRSLKISYPESTVEQRRIVAILDEVFKGIAIAKANAEKNLQAADELFDSYSKAIFGQVATGVPGKRIDQISENLDYKRIPVTKSERVAGDYPYYGASGIVDYVADYIFEGDALLVSEDGANLLARSTPIAFSVTGRYWVNNHAHILKFDHMATQKFVEYYLESISLDGYITGAAQPKLNQKALNSIQIPIPDSIDAQIEAVRCLEDMAKQMQRFKAVCMQKIAVFEELKKSFLHQAFTGQL